MKIYNGNGSSHSEMLRDVDEDGGLKRIGWGYIASFDLSIGSNESRWITNVEMPNLYNNHLLSFSFGESGIYLLPFNGEFLQKHMISKFAFSLFLQRT